MPTASVGKLFLRPKPFLDAARRDWQFDTFAWLLRNTGGYPKFLETTLVLPTEEHFPGSDMSGHAGASALFRQVRDHAGMADWPCAIEPLRNETLETCTPESAKPKMGDGRIPVFHYNPDITEPMTLVATFAHELALYLTQTFDEPPPGGEELREHAVDLTAVFMGFGLFVGNSAFQTRTQGFLNEGELMHAQALFCLLLRVDTEDVEPHLNPHLRKYLRLAARDLAQYEAKFQRLKATFPVVYRDPAGETMPTR